MITRHIAQTLHIALLAFIEHFLQIVQLHGEHTYVIRYIADIVLYGVDGTLPTVDITVETLQVFQLLRNLCLIGFQSLLMLADVLLYLCLLLTQSLDGRIGYGCCLFPFGRRCFGRIF